MTIVKGTQPGPYINLKNLSVSTLYGLVTSNGIFASSAKGMEGMYYGHFGRDSAITAALIHHAESSQSQSLFLDKAVYGILKLSRWQGRRDDMDTGEEYGKIPHEIREQSIYYEHLTNGRVMQGLKPWFVDPEDKVLKCWDSNDSTPLWIIVVSRLYFDQKINLEEETLNALRNGLIWCMRNIDEFGGFAGYRFNKERKWDGLLNQSWKDSEKSYLLEDGSMPEYPIKDVGVNAFMWSALKYGQKIFSSVDSEFAHALEEKANDLKVRFNSINDGFLMYDEKSGYYFAEAIDGKGRKLTHVSCDPAFALWAYCDSECIIEDKHIGTVVNRIFMDDLYDPKAGIRTYSKNGKAYDEVKYHRGDNTFWPFTAGLVAKGLDNFGYKKESKDLLIAMVKGIERFNSCIELFLKEGEEYVRYKEASGQTSSTDQAWTAAALYFATSYLNT